MSTKIRIGITQGDINGIGYEIILKTFADPLILELCTPVIYGNQKILQLHKKNVTSENIEFQVMENATKLHPTKVNLVDITKLNDCVVEFGKASKKAGEAALVSLEMAVSDIMANRIDALVTSPINKDSIQSDKFKFPGHTEYLADKFKAPNYMMLMVSESLKIGTVTGHIPIHEVASNITIEKVYAKIKILNQCLKQDFGITKPKIAILGLNPHAGDAGLLGKQETEIIQPAIDKAKKDNILAIGPYAADGFFGSGNYRNFDGILAMYHDQGLIPFKTIAYYDGVNYTAGLPYVRTSPDHGTGYDIAGKDKADEASFRQAIFAAIDIYRKKIQYQQINANPLPLSTSRLAKLDDTKEAKLEGV